MSIINPVAVNVYVQVFVLSCTFSEFPLLLFLLPLLRALCPVVRSVSKGPGGEGILLSVPLSKPPLALGLPCISLEGSEVRWFRAVAVS